MQKRNFRQNPGNFLLFKGFYKNTVFSTFFDTEDTFFSKSRVFFPIFCNFLQIFGIFGKIPKTGVFRILLLTYKSEVRTPDPGLARFSRKIAKIGKKCHFLAKIGKKPRFWGPGIPGNPQLLAHTIRYAPTWFNLTT